MINYRACYYMNKEDVYYYRINNGDILNFVQRLYKFHKIYSKIKDMFNLNIKLKLREKKFIICSEDGHYFSNKIDSNTKLNIPTEDETKAIEFSTRKLAEEYKLRYAAPRSYILFKVCELIN